MTRERESDIINFAKCNWKYVVGIWAEEKSMLWKIEHNYYSYSVSECRYEKNDEQITVVWIENLKKNSILYALKAKKTV